MTILVIPYALDDGEQLKYTLRSIDTNLHLGDLQIVVTGDRPEVLNDTITYLPGNFEETKILRITGNVLRAASELAGEKRVLFVDDDYLLMEPATEVLNGYRMETLEEQVQGMIRGMGREWYLTQAMQATLHACRSMSVPLSWDIHRPLWFNPDSAQPLLESIMKMKVTPTWRSMYGNFARTEADGPAFPMRDGIFQGAYRPIGLSWLSSDEESWAGPFGRRVKQMFTTPSRWER